jgi:hypothetical protein
LLRPGGYPPKLQEWHDKLAPLVAEARQQLREMNVSKLVMRSGCTQDSDGVLRLALLWRDYQVHVPDFVIRRADTGEEPSSFQQALILSYMVTANGTTPSSRWVAFRDLGRRSWRTTRYKWGTPGMPSPFCPGFTWRPCTGWAMRTLPPGPPSCSRTLLPTTCRQMAWRFWAAT